MTNFLPVLSEYRYKYYVIPHRSKGDINCIYRVATLPEKHTEYDFFLGHGIIWMGREIWKELKSQGIGKLMAIRQFSENILPLVKGIE